jgi:transcriptional antiterminator
MAAKRKDINTHALGINKSEVSHLWYLTAEPHELQIKIYIYHNKLILSRNKGFSIRYTEQNYLPFISHIFVIQISMKGIKHKDIKMISFERMKRKYRPK